MTPPTDTPRTIPLIGTAIRSFSPGRDKPPKLIGEIGCLEVGNWRDQPYIPEIKLDSLMTQEVVKLWIKQFTRDESISLADQTYLKPAYIFENLRKTLAALILSGKERAIVHFCRQRDSDYKLPISRQDLVGIADLADSSFYFHQFKFIAPKIEEGMPVSISMNHILPIRQRELIGGGTFSEVSKIQIDEHQDGITAKRTSRESTWYACKEVKIEDGDDRKSFNDEVFALGFLKGRTTNVVKLRAHFIHETDTSATGYMIFELADCTLGKYMKNPANLPPATKESLHKLLKKASNLASCLSAFHHPQSITRDEEEGLERVGIHRDLSLNNILVKGDDFMISDFGLARVKEEKVKGDSGTRWPYGDRGPYLAPECHAGATIGRSADVWALGCILLDVLSFGLLGYENGVEEFRRRRTVTVQTSNDPYQLCAFYEGQFVKKKVLDWIEYLRKQQLYDSLVENYLDVIRAMLRNGPLYSGKHWLITDVQGYFQRIFDGSYSPVSRANQSRTIQQVSPPATPVGKPGIAPNIPAALSPQTGSSGHSLKQPPATTPRTPRLEDPLQQLICFDTVFLVDDSREDTEGWSDIRQTLKRLAEITILYDKNGIDLHFVSGQADLRSVLRSQNMEVILDAFDRNTPPPSDLISLFHKVDKLLSNYVQRFERARDKAERCGLEHDFTNLNLIILTDGRSLLNNMGFKELKRIIYEWAQKLDNLYAPVGQVGMQFVLIGGSEEAWKKVKELDNKLHLHGKRTTRDIVDARKYDPNEHFNNTILLEKILLGGNCKAYDDDDQDANYNGTSAEQ